MPLPDGVHAIPQTIARGDTEVTINPAAVETGRGVLLLDVGYEGHLDQLESALDAADLSLDDVWAALVTHQDGDHAGGLRAVVDRTDALVLAHRRCSPFLDGRQDPLKGDGERYPPVDVDVEVADEVVVRTVAGPMEVVYTPGHAPGHVSLYFPDEKLLLAADALTAAEGSLAGPSREFTLDMPTATESVGRLSECDVERTLCYHGGFVEEGTGAIAKIWNDMVG